MPQVAASDPPFKNVSSQINKFLEWQKGYYNFYPGEVWTPSVNLYETDGSYLVCVDLAGVDKEKIDIEVSGNKLTLRGARAIQSVAEMDSSENPSKRVKVHLMEIDHGPFARDVELPHNVHSEKIHARYLNGMLWIELPKRN